MNEHLINNTPFSQLSEDDERSTSEKETCDFSLGDLKNGQLYSPQQRFQ
jgi:hypothetical protein